jgi:TonB family protein
MKPNQQNRPNTNVPGYELTNSFLRLSELKQRVQMLTKPNSSPRALWRYPFVLAFAGLLLMCTQVEKEIDQAVNNREKVDQSLKLTQIKGEIYTVVEKQPEFPGGVDGLNKYIQENLRYPAAAQRANVQGRVFMSFVVTQDGGIADAKVLKGIGFGCDEEAIRVTSRMPKWKPGSQDGKPLNVRYVLPIAFELEPEALKQQAK